MSDPNIIGGISDPDPQKDHDKNCLGNVSISPGGFLITDSMGIIQQADQGVAALLHVSAHHLPGQSLATFAVLGCEKCFESLCGMALSQQAVIDGEIYLRQSNDAQQAVLVSINVVRIDNGSVSTLQWLLRNVTQREPVHMLDIAAELAAANERLQVELHERQRAEAAAAKRERELGALHRATTALLSTLDIQGLLGQILDAATSAVSSAEKGMVHLVARDTGQLEMRAAIGYSDPRIQKIPYPNSGYVARAMRSREPILIRDAQQDPSLRYSSQISEIRAIQSVIVAPLIHPNGEILGALSIESPRPMAFNEDDLRLLTSFAVTATTAIYNAQLHAEVQKLAITDTLTGLYNRHGFEELGRREIERLRRFGHPLSIIMVDVDEFKQINDTFGHKVGDWVIQTVAKRLVSSLREVDIVGRFGGDEFTILLPETDLFTAINVAERLLTLVSQAPIVFEQASLKLTVSVGVVKATSEFFSLESLLERADRAMYQAKQGGKNRVEVL